MLKRVFDIILSICGLVVLSPILLITAIIIRLESEGPALFIQTRVGINRKNFKLYKFRSMRLNKGLKLTTGEHDTRITKIGKVIRKLHLDEAVQLINVLKGDMSVVGPRPEIPKYTENHKKKWDIVLSVKPGITGLGIISYARREYDILSKSKSPEKDYLKTVLPKKLDIEISYVRNHSLWGDCKIIFLTIYNSIFLKY